LPPLGEKHLISFQGIISNPIPLDPSFYFEKRAGNFPLPIPAMPVKKKLDNNYKNVNI